MKIITTLKSIRTEINRARRKGLMIGFVPTMGALHQGHLELMRQAKKDNDLVVISIFVNPLQFGPKEDFKRYPRNLKGDAKLAKTAGVDIIFAPTVKAMYHNTSTFVDMSNLTDKLCGQSRPGHFRGVMTVVTKLLNIVQPDVAYFGQKDFQQALIIRKMARDLDMNLEIKTLPTVREPDGLAMSSRNKYLSVPERYYAQRLYRSLLKAKELIISGEKDCRKIRDAMLAVIKTIPGSRIDYVEIADPETLKTIEKIKKGHTLIALAVYAGKTRLIDNILC
ncbi:MAG: pantoate--beta-alanine ligase [Planctomycetes bacterium]|nr:pantoate--beta-alanine ligase [Planctomycetota bacterium]